MNSFDEPRYDFDEEDIVDKGDFDPIDYLLELENAERPY
jgi:hypothetical protein